MKRVLPVFLLLILSVSFATYAQSIRSVRGVVQDTAGRPIQSVRIKLVSASDSLATYTNTTGTFTIPNVKASKFTITTTFIGFEDFKKEFTAVDNSNIVNIGVIKVKELSNELEAVTIVGAVPVTVKEDTVEFSAAAFPTREGDAVEEMVKKLPGVTVDKDGNVTTSDGKPVNKIRVNGKDFFGDDVATAIQSLPAEIVKNIQIIDDYGDEARLTGIKSDEPTKVLNINIRPDKNKGYLAQGSLGKGDQNRYTGSIRGNIMNENRQISLQSFLGNITPRGGNGGSGLNETKTAGLSYRDQFGKKISVDGSYNFYQRDNSTIGATASQNVFTSRFDNQTQNSTSSNSNHNFSGNFEYKIDSMNYLKVSPNISYNSSNGGSAGLTNTSIPKASSIRDNRSSSTSQTPNMGVNMFYNLRFKKRGRNFNFNANLGSSNQDQGRNSINAYTNTDSILNTVILTNQNQHIITANDNRRDGFRMSYNEPLSKTSFLQFSYGLNHSHTENVRSIYDINSSNQEIFNSTISNNYAYGFKTERYGLNFRVVQKKYNYTLGVAAQPVTLSGLDISRNIETVHKSFNWIPNARFVYKFTTKSEFDINYNGRSNQPGFAQLQPTTDNSNLQNTIVGNPNLKPEFINNLSAKYNQTDYTKGYTILTSVSYNTTQNKIVTTRQNIGTQQTTSYVNTDGFYNILGNYNFSKMFSERKYTISYFGGTNYSNNIAFNNNARTINKNLNFSQGFRFRYDVKDKIELSLNGNYSRNAVAYSSDLLQDNINNSFNFGMYGRKFFNNLTFGYNVSKTINHGLSSGLNQDPLLMNLSAEYRFFKKAASIKFEGVDLLNQNTGISRSVSGDQIVDSQYNQLARYFLLSFNLRINKFAGGVNPNNRQQQGGQGGQGGRPGGNSGPGGFGGGR